MVSKSLGSGVKSVVSRVKSVESSVSSVSTVKSLRSAVEISPQARASCLSYSPVVSPTRLMLRRLLTFHLFYLGDISLIRPSSLSLTCHFSYSHCISRTWVSSL